MRRFPRRLPAPPRRLAALTTAAAAAALGGAAGCASSGTAPVQSANGTTQTSVRMDGGGAATYQTELTHTDRATETDLPVSADRAFAVLPLVYEQVGLKINTAVSDTRTVGVNAVHTRRVGKDPLSRFLTCGTDVTGSALADTYSVTLTVLSRVTPSGTTGALLSTQVMATAQPMSTSGTTITCQSTGALEDRIAKTAALRAAG